MRAHREAAEVGQDRVASVAREMGLPNWTRSTVAFLEAGNRKLYAEELLILPYVAFRAFGVDTSVLDLLHADAPLTLSATAKMHQPAVESAVAGGLGDVKHVLRTLPRDFEVPWSVNAGKKLREVVTALEPASKQAANIPKLVWPGAKYRQIVAAERDATGDAEQKAARRLQVPPLAVSLAAHRLWGRSLTVERDRRVDTASTPGTPARTKQALRGRETRRLVDEIQPLVAEVHRQWDM